MALPTTTTNPRPPAHPRDATARLSDIIEIYRPSRLFKNAKETTATTSLDYDDQGELLVSCGDDEMLQLYTCRDGNHTKALFSRKYGAHLAIFTHHSQSILYASTKVDDQIRYLSTHDNQYIRYFPGHTDTVTCLAMAPESDDFVSCSLDNTIRLWDVNTPNAKGKLILHAPYLAAFDPTGTVLAIASPSTESLLLYDLRNFTTPPFATFELDQWDQKYIPRDVTSSTKTINTNPDRWTSIEFSNDGKWILLGTASGYGHYLLDSYRGDLHAFLAFSRPPPGSSSTSPPPLVQRSRSRLAPGERFKAGGPPLGQTDVCFTPDGRYIVGGVGDQSLGVWDTNQVQAAPGPPEVGQSGQISSTNGSKPASDVKILYPHHELPSPHPAAVVAFNPRFNQCATADRDVLFWVPDLGGGGGKDEGDEMG
ncbi:MAG: member of Set1p complex, histone methyl transferase [Watsoniomyces obsoletus]|nr:MAG: member of Set1p complex, histone methyl transferase [Watsoniomyces obsoletus]